VGLGVWFASNGMALGVRWDMEWMKLGFFLHGFGALMVHLGIMVALCKC
jgi:hypothetical protein